MHAEKAVIAEKIKRGIAQEKEQSKEKMQGLTGDEIW